MAKNTSLEDKLIALNALEHTLPEVATPILEQTLQSASNILVARAAQIIATTGNSILIPSLIHAFDRFLQNSVQTDKTCRAKEAIITALDTLLCWDAGVYLRGVKHIQMEPVFGGRQDTAANLRAQCVMALARLHDADVFLTLTDLLLDSEPQPRIAAVQALTHLGGEQSELLLRMKVLTGDADSEVLGRCFSGLLQIAYDRSLPFVAHCVTTKVQPLADLAAFALGESHSEGAYAILKTAWEQTGDLQFRKTLVRAIALSRVDDAFTFLLDIISHEGRNIALIAVESLTMYTFDERRHTMIREAVEQCGETQVIALYHELYR